jgi:putative cardiolipin synthase
MPAPRAADLLRSHALARAIATLAVLSLAGCATIDLRDVARKPSYASQNPMATRLGKAIYAEAAKHPGQSAFRVVESGLAGFAARVALIDAAEHTVDLQYYVMEGETAELVAGRLLAASERGVRVRLLLDDLGQHGREGALAALSSHPNVEVRTFNPLLLRGPAKALALAEYVVRGAQLDRRMHNKLFVVDNAIAMIGGRNIGDAYFEAPGPIDFQDLDLVAAGPVVRGLSASFDDYWNSDYSVPIEALLVSPPSAQDVAEARAHLAALRERERDTAYGRAVAASRIARDLSDGKLAATWARARVLADSPRKVDPARDDGAHRVAEELIPAIASVSKELVVVSPYLVPDEAAMAAIKATATRGARIRMLTNSLATTDVPLAHAGYAAARPALLDAGVELHELKPQAIPFAPRGARHAPSSGSRTTLHAKAIAIDRRVVFLSSMNLDQRSIHLNTELGLWIDSTALASDVVRRFDEAVKPDNSYLVQREPDGRIEWITASDGVVRRYDDEPDTTPAQRLRAKLAQWLPIEGEL